MSLAVSNIETSILGFHRLEEYEPLIGDEAVRRILTKAEQVRHLRTVHISSTFYGGGVAEILTPLTLLMEAMGVESGWRMIQGTPDFFACTKKIHNMLQGGQVEFDEREKAIYEQVVFENAARLHLQDRDVIVVHDPQPLPLIAHFEKSMPWIWECHVDLSKPNPAVWDYLRGFVDRYDTAVFSLPEYAQDLQIPQHFITPAINPFSAKNREMTDEEIDHCLTTHRIPLDRPIIVQVSRFDKWKDPAGVIRAFQAARREVECTLVLLGNSAIDDPEGGMILETIVSSPDDRILAIAVDDPTLVNALQRRAAVVLQKSLREGFGLTVTEAMWKGAAVIGGNVGGIRKQITDGETGFLVDSVEQAAVRIVQILKDPALRRRLGANAKEAVRRNFLLSRLAEDWLDLFGTFEGRVSS